MEKRVKVLRMERMTKIVRMEKASQDLSLRRERGPAQWGEVKREPRNWVRQVTYPSQR